MKKLIVHIGLRKTGSSALQELLARETALLHQHGIDYPARLTQFPAHQELAWSLMTPPPAYVQEDISREATFDHYCQAIEANIARGFTSILSSEDLSLLSMNYAALTYMKQRFEAYDPQIVFLRRDPISYHVSNYKHAIAAGRETQSFFDYVFRMHTLIYTHPGLHREIWSGVFGEDNVQVLDYSAETFKKMSTLAFFLRETCGVTIDDQFVSHRSNTGVSNAAADFFLELNRSDLVEERLQRIKGVVRNNTVASSEQDFLETHLSATELKILRQIYGMK